MKKRVIIGLFVLFVIGYLNFVQASFGVSPGKYEVDFSPGLKQEFVFGFIFDKDAEAEVYVAGNLKDYVKLNTNKLVGGGLVKVTINLPNKIETPGINNIEIGAKQFSSPGSGITLAGHVIARIEVKVPYPGKYAEVRLYSPNANAGDHINFTITIDNLGTDTIIAESKLKILDFQNNSKDIIKVSTDVIESKKSETKLISYETTDYKPGDYKAIVIVEYGGKKPVEDEKKFRLGELYVNISNHTREFIKHKINRFDIKVESLWNDPIYNLYSNVSIINYDISFVTPSIKLEPWSRNDLTGFFDTSEIKENKFKANITLFYHEKLSSEVVDLAFEKSFNYSLYIVIGVILIILVLLGIIFFLFRKIKNEKKQS